MPRSVGLAQAWGTIGLNGRSVLTTVTGASVLVCNLGTSTPISATIYADPTSGTTLSNPLTTDATGTRQFYLEDPAIVTLIKTAAGYTFANEDVFVGEPSAGGSVVALDDLSNVTIPTPTSNQDVVFNDATPAQLVAISHKKRPRGYAGYTGNGTADDSAVWATMVSEITAAGRGYIECHPSDTFAVKNAELATRLIVEGNGARVLLHSSATNSDDLFRTTNFNTLIGTTTAVGGGAPWGFEMDHLYLELPTDNTGRHTIAIYGTSYKLLHLKISHRGLGAALRTDYGVQTADWTQNQPNQYETFNSIVFDHINILDLPSTAAVDTSNQTVVSITNVTNASPPVITTSRAHALSAGQIVTIASVGGATGVNGTWAVASVPSGTTFTVTTTAPGVYTSGGTVTFWSTDASLVVTNVSNTTNPTVTTSRPHFLNVGQTVVIASVAGATGVNGTWTVLATPSSTTFTITTAAPGVFSGNGGLSYHTTAAWLHTGPSDGHADEIYIAASNHVAGRRGLLTSKSQYGPSGSGTGLDIGKIHIYNNFDVAIDINSGGLQVSDAQFEGSYKCCLLIRGGNGRSSVRGRVYGGQGGVTLLSLRDSNQNMLHLDLHQAGSGNAPPTGYNNVYWENYSSGNLSGSLMMQHDYNTNAKAASGSVPGQSPGFTAFLNAFGISSATLSTDFGAVNSTTTWQYEGAGASQSATAPDPGANGTITISGASVVRVSPAAARTGVILAAGTEPGQSVTVINEAAAANTITFDVAGTSNVADGATTVIPGLRASSFYWDSSTSRWYRTA